MNKVAVPLALLASTALLSFALPVRELQDEHKVGFTDTPFLPGGKWRVGDSSRPQPPVVTPGIGTAPPSDAIVLFDGTGLDAWQNKKADQRDEKWKLVENGAMEVTDAGSMETVQSFGSIQLHLEWASPEKIERDGQFRGNSGVILMGYYEVQILDSFENPTYADGTAGAMYGQYPPLVNASRGPGEWQSFDIIFEAPVFEGEELVSPAVVTVLHNGVLIHHRREFVGRVAYKAVGRYSPHPAEQPLLLQDHWFPVRFRNIWVRRI